MYRAQKDLVQNRQLKVQELAIPFSILGNATPASKTITRDEPTVLFLKTEGLNQVTEAAGALDAGEAAPTFAASATDSTGIVNALVKVGEEIQKVVSVQVLNRAAGTSQVAYINSTPLSANGDKILINMDLTTDLSGANLADMCLIVKYIVQ